MKSLFTQISHFGLLPLAISTLSFGSSIAQIQNDLVVNTPHSNAIQFNVAEDKGTHPHPMATFVEMTKPTGGYKCVVDMAVFNGRLFLSTADDPLGNWGAKVFYTTDAATYTQCLSDASSQGYLRMGVFDNQLWIPDGDPNGMDPGYLYLSSTGNSGSFTKTTITGAVHTFDVIKYNNKAYVSNGMASSLGGMCEFNGTNLWSSVNQPGSSFRLKYMTEFNGKLFVANANPNSGVDYYLWSGSVASAPQSMDKVAGSGSTYQIYTSSQGKLFWTVVYSGAIHVLTSTDGISWTPSPTLDGKFVSDFAELNGKLYALDWKGGLWESSDHNTFTLIATTPAPDTFGPLPVTGGYNADARASMAAFNGAIYCGSSTTGKVYKVDVATSTSELPQTSFNYTMTDHSVIFNLDKSAPVELRIYSVHGSLINSVSEGMVGAGTHEIDLSNMNPGFYLLQAVVGTELKGIKFVKR